MENWKLYKLLCTKLWTKNEVRVKRVKTALQKKQHRKLTQTPKSKKGQTNERTREHKKINSCKRMKIKYRTKYNSENLEINANKPDKTLEKTSQA